MPFARFHGNNTADNATIVNNSFGGERPRRNCWRSQKCRAIGEYIGVERSIVFSGRVRQLCFRRPMSLGIFLDDLGQQRLCAFFVTGEAAFHRDGEFDRAVACILETRGIEPALHDLDRLIIGKILDQLQPRFDRVDRGACLVVLPIFR